MAPEAIRALAGREARPLAVHVGGGIATRDAYHEQRAAHREALERGTAAPERLALSVHGHRTSGEHRRGRCSPLTGVIKSEGKQEKQVRRRGEGGGVGAARFQLLRRGDGLRAEMWSRRW